MAGILSRSVHNMFIKHMNSAEKYVVSDDCISCGKCVSLCVMNNVTINEGEKPTFGKNFYDWHKGRVLDLGAGTGLLSYYWYNVV